MFTNTIEIRRSQCHVGICNLLPAILFVVGISAGLASPVLASDTDSAPVEKETAAKSEGIALTSAISPNSKSWAHYTRRRLSYKVMDDGTVVRRMPDGTLKFLPPKDTQQLAGVTEKKKNKYAVVLKKLIPFF